MQPRFSRVLDQEEVEKLQRKVASMTPHKAPSWPAKDDLPTILKAAELGLDSVEFAGKKFKIKYDDNGDFFLKPKEGFVPCGWFDVDTLRKKIEVANA